MKRSILKVVAKIFDPLGVISLVTFQMKVLFQELCKQKINWDDPLLTRINEDWASWCNELSKIEHVKIPRCYTHGDQQDPVSHQLHGFCDSPLSGYAAVVYLRATSGASIQTAFVASKTRVALLFQLTIPRLLRGTAYVKRFVHNISRKEWITGPLSTNEIQEAEILWIKEMQGHLQEDELEKQLGLFKDEKGIIRCRGRLGNSQASYDTKFSALLSRNHYVTSLIIRYCHERVMHNGLKETLTEVRSKYRIPKGRQTVKKELFGCNICRRFQGRSYPVPESPDLPEFRVRDVHAFSCVGVDFAGPLFVKAKVKDDPEMTKVYIALLTCATSRAVYLELVPSLDAPTFLLCLRRFIGRRGLLKLIVSDNAKTFQASEKALVYLNWKTYKRTCPARG